MKKTNMCVTREAAMLELQQLGFMLVDLTLTKHSLDHWPILVTAQLPTPGAGSTNHGPGKCKGGTARCGYMKRNWSIPLISNQRT